MEDTLQQEKQESEYKNPNEDQGGIRRRLRDRDLLRKKKAEAEEKETNQLESQRKRLRAEDKRGAKKRGRPKKNEPTPEISVVQEEAAGPQEAAAAVVVPEPAEFITDQTPDSLLPLLVGSQPASVLATPAALAECESVQSPVFAPTLTSPSPVNPTPSLVTPPVLAPSLTKVLDTTPVSVQDLDPAPAAVPVTAPTQAPVPPAAPALPTASLQVETLYIESEGREAPDQVLIEDVGPEKEEDISLAQDKRADEDLIETPPADIPEQNKMFSMPTLSSLPPPQEYLPGNSF